MITCPYCEGKMHPHDIRHQKRTGEIKRRFKCTCCSRIRSAYSADGGETWKWDKRPSSTAWLDLKFA